jgi:diacylglycerol kinase (ATP)
MLAAGATMIVNPRAGRGLGASLHGALAERLRCRWSAIQVRLARTSAEAEDCARAEATRGVRAFVVLGGDGTVNAVLNGIAGAPGALAESVIGVLPGGTGNDLAGTLGLGTSLLEAATRLCRSEPRLIDLGQLDERLFLNVSAGGLFAEASEAVTSEAKSLAGRLAYLVGGSRALLEHEGFDVTLRAQTPEGPIEWHGSVSMFAVCNAPTAGGGRPLAPFARSDDGWLDAFFVEQASPLSLARVLLEMSDGTHVDDEQVVGFLTSSLDLSFSRPTHVNVDGEVAVIPAARYRVLPCATRVLVDPWAASSGAPERDGA